MVSDRGRRKRGLPGLFRRQDGSVTVEFVIWIPIFLFILGFVADASAIYLAQAAMWNVARDCVRRMTTGQYTTNAQVTTCVQQNVLFGAHNASYTVTPTFAASANGDDSVEVKVPVTKIWVFGVLPVFGGWLNSSLDVKVTMLSEN